MNVAQIKLFVGIRLTPRIVTRADAEAARIGVAKAEVYRRWLDDYVDQLEARDARR